MTTDQPAQGSTADYCSNSTANVHFLVIDMRGGALASVKRCSWCNWIDFDDLDEQIRERIAEGLRQATEGWERYWGLHHDGYEVVAAPSREAAARLGEDDPGGTVVSRLVGPWEPAEQPGEARWELGTEDVTHLVQSAPERLVVHLDNRPAEQPEPARGVGWRLARDEEIQDAAHMAAMEQRMEHEAEQPEGSDR